eukprot:SAG22_NODE_2954_length_2078_cov_2.190500_4_plen_183_part_01
MQLCAPDSSRAYSIETGTGCSQLCLLVHRRRRRTPATAPRSWQGRRLRARPHCRCVRTHQLMGREEGQVLAARLRQSFETRMGNDSAAVRQAQLGAVEQAAAEGAAAAHGHSEAAAGRLAAALEAGLGRLEVRPCLLACTRPLHGVCRHTHGAGGTLSALSGDLAPPRLMAFSQLCNHLVYTT